MRDPDITGIWDGKQWRYTVTEQPRTAAGRALLEAYPDTTDGEVTKAILAIEAQARPAVASELRAVATDVLHSWDAGDIDNDYDRIASAFDSLRAALASDAGSVGAGFYDDPDLPGNER